MKLCQCLFKETRGHGFSWSPAEGCAPAPWASILNGGAGDRHQGMTQVFQSLTRWGKPRAASLRYLKSSFWVGWRWQVLAWAPSHYITNTHLCKITTSCWHCQRWFHSLRWKKGTAPAHIVYPSKGNLLYTVASLTVPGTASQELSKTPKSEGRETCLQQSFIISENKHMP